MSSSSATSLVTQSSSADVEEDGEQRLIREFFDFFGPTGFFVDVGANHPKSGSQSWHLERQGWRGVLIEPQPDLAEQLRNLRRSRVFAVACSKPENSGRSMPFHVDGALSSLDRDRMAPFADPKSVIEVPVRTLDSILLESKAPRPIDFLSVDVEGHEIEALSGFDFAYWRPRLVLLEDHVGNLNRHRFMRSKGYRLVRRTEINGWYVPENAPIRFGLAEEIRLARKYYLGLPLRRMRHAWRRTFLNTDRQSHAPA